MATAGDSTRGGGMARGCVRRPATGNNSGVEFSFFDSTPGLRRRRISITRACPISLITVSGSVAQRSSPPAAFVRPCARSAPPAWPGRPPSLAPGRHMRFVGPDFGYRPTSATTGSGPPTTGCYTCSPERWPGRRVDDDDDPPSGSAGGRRGAAAVGRTPCCWPRPAPGSSSARPCGRRSNRPPALLRARAPGPRSGINWAPTSDPDCCWRSSRAWP